MGLFMHLLDDPPSLDDAPREAAPVARFTMPLRAVSAWFTALWRHFVPHF